MVVLEKGTPPHTTTLSFSWFVLRCFRETWTVNCNRTFLLNSKTGTSTTQKWNYTQRKITRFFTLPQWFHQNTYFPKFHESLMTAFSLSNPTTAKRVIFMTYFSSMSMSFHDKEKSGKMSMYSTCIFRTPPESPYCRRTPCPWLSCHSCLPRPSCPSCPKEEKHFKGTVQRDGSGRK